MDMFDALLWSGGSPNGKPIDVATDEGMAAVLTLDNVGRVYRFTGATGTYVNGDLYIVEVDA